MTRRALAKRMPRHTVGVAMPNLPPHEITLLHAAIAAMEAEQDQRVQHSFPVQDGRIIIDAAFIPKGREPWEPLRVLPDPP